MNKASSWPQAMLDEMRRLRDAGRTWPQVGDALRVCPDAARREGRKMGLCHPPTKRCAGPLPRQPRALAQTQPVQRSPEQLAGARPTLPPGATWGLLIAGTSLDGLPYPPQSEEQA